MGQLLQKEQEEDDEATQEQVFLVRVLFRQRLMQDRAVWNGAEWCLLRRKEPVRMEILTRVSIRSETLSCL